MHDVWCLLGKRVGHMGHTLLTPQQEGSGFLGSKDHAGFLYIRPTFQCLQKLVSRPLIGEPCYALAILRTMPISSFFFLFILAQKEILLTHIRSSLYYILGLECLDRVLYLSYSMPPIFFTYEILK